MPYIQSLDGLRGVAVVLILLFHAGHLEGGWLGVDLFFVLSGFLITSLLLVEFDSSGSLSLPAFWGRRARRLLPALFALLLGVCGWSIFFAAPSDVSRIAADGLATLFYAANWHAIYAGHDYWEIFRAPSPLDHTWSLAIEEQFYLLWPPIALVALRQFRGSHRALAVTASALAIASAVWMAVLFDPDEGTARVYFGADTRAAATLVGAAVAAMLQTRLREWPGNHHQLGDVVAVIGVAALLAAGATLDGNNPLVYRGGLFALILTSGSIIVGLLYAPGGLANRLLSLRPLRELGTISYGLYLWHWPVFIAMTPDRLGIDGWLLTGARLAVTLCVAWASFYLLERPIRRGNRAPRTLSLAALGSMVVVLAAGWLTLTLTAGKLPQAESRKAVKQTGIEQSDIMLIGDSLSFILGPEFLKESGRRNLQPIVMGIPACATLKSTGLRYLSGHKFDLTPCLAHREQWLTTVVKTKPKTVIVLEGWSGEGSKRVGEIWTEPCTLNFDRAYRADLTELVTRIDAAGSTAAIVTTPAPFTADLPSKFSKLWGGTDERELDALFKKRVACQNRVKQQVVRRTGAVLLDLEAEICPGGECIRSIDGVVLRSDGMHFEGPGGAWAAEWLLDRASELSSH